MAVAPDSNSGGSPQGANNLNASGSSQATESRDRNFAVTIQASGNGLVHQHGKQKRRCQLQAGMEASASIISRQETFLQFMLRKARILTNL